MEGKSKDKGHKDKAELPVEEGGQLVFECPLYDISCSRERVFCGGGGGATRSGVPNQWAALHWMPNSDQLKGCAMHCHSLCHHFTVFLSLSLSVCHVISCALLNHVLIALSLFFLSFSFLSVVALSSNGSHPARSGSVCPSDVSIVAVTAGSSLQLFQLDNPRVSRGGAADARLLRCFVAAPTAAAAAARKPSDDEPEMRVTRWHPSRPLLCAGSSDGWLRVYDASAKLRAAALLQTDAAVMDAAWRSELLAAVSPKSCTVWKVLPPKTKEPDVATAAAAAAAASDKQDGDTETADDASKEASDDDKLLAPVVSFGSHHQARHADATFRGCAWAGADSAPFLVVGSVSRAARNSWLCCYGGPEFERLVSCEALPYALTAVTSSQDGRLVGCGSAEGHVAVYSVTGGVLSWVMTTNPHTFFVSGVCFSPDASHVLSCSGDRALFKQLVVQQPRRRFSKVMLVFFSFLVLLFAILYARVQ